MQAVSAMGKETESEFDNATRRVYLITICTHMKTTLLKLKNYIVVEIKVLAELNANFAYF